MSFARWLRSNSEHYLLAAAQDRVAKSQGVTRPRRPQGPREWFWLGVFVPVYRALPWPVRKRVMRLMPGSHRRSWPAPPTRSGPAV